MGTTSNHHAPYDLGYTRATMAVTERSESVRMSRSQKSGLSSDCGLQPAHMKSELLVIADQHAAGEVTARSQQPKVRSMTGVKS